MRSRAVGSRFIGIAMVAMLLVACGDAAQTTTPSPASEEPTPGETAGETAAQPSASSGAYEPTPLEPPVTVRVGILRVANPLFIGIDKGYFEAEGLNVQLEMLASGSELLPLLASGQLDVGLSSPGAALFNAIGAGVDISLVADASRYRPGYGAGAVVVRKELFDSGEISEIEDLQGRSFAVTAPGVATYMMAVRMLEDAGMSEDDVVLETMAYPDMLAALASGQVDAANLTEPFITLGQQRGILERWLGHDELFPNQQQAVLTYSAAFAEEEDVAVRFMAAWLRSVRDWQAAFGDEENRDAAIREEAIAILSRDLELDPEVLAAMVPAWQHPNGDVNAEDLAVQQQWYADHGLVTTPADIEDVVDMTFAEQAVERIGSADVDD